jgi:N-acetyl-gamma-glutamyl-phosphate reductase
MIRVGLVGATGYTGVELLRLLARHPQVRITTVTSRAEAGMPVAQLFPSLRGAIDLPFTEPDLKALQQCELVFFATPNGTAMQSVPALLEAGVKVVDLSADFRLKDPAEWERWYKLPHACPHLLAEAAYGLPELNLDAIR